MNTDAKLLNLAESYKRSQSGIARNLIRGKADRLIKQTYTITANREAVWSEWCKLAEPNPKAWLRL